MRYLIVMCLMALMAAMLPSSQSEKDDPYSVGTVRAALREQSTGVFNSWTQKYLDRLGDGASIAILKGLSERELLDPQTLKSLLPIIHDAFSEPQFISLDLNKQPQITILLLNHLLSRAANPAERQEIQRTIDYVTVQTKKKLATKPRA